MGTKQKDEPRLRGFNYEEVAEMFSVRPRQVQRWCEEGHLGYITMPQGRRILERHIQAFIEARDVEPVS